MNVPLMTRSAILLAVILALSCGLAEAAPPNVVLILVDDLGKHDLGFEGSSFYETPEIDALAARSMRFRQGYACCQVCSPSRASILLGQFPARHGITDWIGAATGSDWNRQDKMLPANYTQELPAEHTSLAEAFREANYRTFFAGKWHLGGDGSHPEDHGFEINRGGHHRGSPPGGFFSPYRNPKLSDGPPGESLTLRLAEETADFINSPAGDEPFFAMLAFYAVHSPIQTTPELWRKYRDKATAQPAPESRFEIDRTLPVRKVQDNPIYGGMMETLDTAVGNVLRAIAARGIAERTIVIFTSDNGGVSSGDAYATSNLPLRGGKGRQWEGGLRVPYLVHVPGLTDAGRDSDVPVTGADFYPTLLELAGLQPRPEQHLDGQSLVSVLRGGELADRPLFWHYPHYGNQGGEPCGIHREGPWKLIHYYEDNRDELYRLDRDLGEREDLAKSEPERVNQMRVSLLRYLNSVGARFPQPDPRYTAAAGLAKQAQIRDKLWPQLESQHARFLQPDFVPDPTWWKSRPAANPANEEAH